MARDSLTIGRLHVTALAPLASPVGFTARIEDALRTSSLPAEWKGRLVLIRHLRVRAGERWPAHLLARKIEAGLSDGAMQPVPGTRASAGAQAVWFADEVSARLALIERLARSRDVSAWFWQRFLPGHADVARQIAQLLTVHGDQMLVVEERVRYFADACRAIADPALIDRAIDHLDGAQLRWLLPESVRRELIRACTDSARQTEAQSSERSEPPQSGTSTSEESELRSIAQHLARAALGSLSQSQRQSQRRESQDCRLTALDRREGQSTSLEGEGVVSEWAGLFFVLNLSRRLGHQIGFTVDWLRQIAILLRIDVADPMHAVLDELDHGGARECEPHQGEPAPLRELRLACRQATRQPLRRVLRRTGRIRLSRTELIVALPLAGVSLPVRIAGLDIDPGWVAALGRVVRFEYD